MKKIILTIMLIITILFASTTTLAANIDKALLYNDHYTKEYLYFNNGNKVKTAVIMYNDGEIHPAYCVERTKDGVGEVDSYEVAFENTMPTEGLWQEDFLKEGLWRIVTNGYPYKTPEQMGLSNSDEAYFATKQAIYRYLAREDVTYYAGGLGEDGERVYQVIDKLIKIGNQNYEGYTGPNSYQEADVNIEKVGGVQIENEKFAQECSVQCNLDYKNITITSNYEMSDIENGKFKIYIPLNIENPEITLNATVTANSKPLLYGRAYDANKQSYLITGDSYEDFTKEITIEVETPKLYTIQILKLDNDKNPLKDAKFEIRDKNNSLVQTLITNKDGIALSKKLEEGTYTVREIEAPEYYLIDESEETIELNKHTTIAFTNTAVNIEVDIEKTGTKEIKPGGEIEYIFPTLKNKSNVDLDNLVWVEELPKEVTINKMRTGTYNEDITYNIYIEKQGEWKLYKEKLSSKVNNEIEFDGTVEKIKVEFGKVKKGFTSIEAPRINCTASENVKEGDMIVNNTSLTGYYKEKSHKDPADHTTETFEDPIPEPDPEPEPEPEPEIKEEKVEHTIIVYEKEETPKELPKTGK